jgi:pyrroline-5-carboxylate reductase
MTAPSSTLAFIGGGNMASAIVGGLIRQGTDPAHIIVVEPDAQARERLLSSYDLKAIEKADESLAAAGLVVWAIKPQVFKEVAQQNRPHLKKAVHLSVAAGIRSDDITQWLGTDKVVRAMPNTPALVGLGQTGLFARAGVLDDEKQWVEKVVATTGQFLWVDQEPLLDAVTAISGSGPAYVFYFIEAMVQAGIDMGLRADQAHQLAVGTFVGASALAQSAQEPPSVLRERVTSKGGTTYAAITSMQRDDVAGLFAKALEAARARAQALGDEFGR